MEQARYPLRVPDFPGNTIMLDPRAYQAIVEKARLPMAQLEGEGHILRAINPAFCKLLGTRKEDLLGKPFGQLIPEGHGCLGLLDEVYKTGEPRSHVKVREEDTDPMYWSYTCLPIKAEEAWTGVMVQVTETGSFSKQATEIDQALLVSSIRQQELTATAERLNDQLHEVIVERDLDLNEQMQLAQQLRIQADELAEADRRKSEFLATLAHELRNPLAPLRNGLELLAMSTEDHEAWDRTHAMMTRQLGHMVRLIDELMDLSRVTRGVIHLQLDAVDLRAVLDEAVEMSTPFRDAQGHTLVLNIADQALRVLGDGMRLTQVFTNLLNNAAKYTDAGGTISVDAEASADEVVVRIVDNGIGIASAQQGRVFDMFAQVDQTHEQGKGGLGVGLHIVKYLVEMHHGRIEVSSDGLGTGSRFTVHLPLVPTPPKPAARTAIVGGGSVPPIYHILVVDDNADAADMIAIILGKLGHEVRVAHNGAQALEVGEHMRPDIVLMDLGMPIMDGRTACRHMRLTPWGRAATIIALTGWGQEEDRRKSEEAGFNDHLVKPISMGALLKVFATVHTDAAE